MKIYHCEDSLEGIFTAIYNTYEDHCIIRDTMVTTIEENLLFSESVEVIPDGAKHGSSCFMQDCGRKKKPGKT